MNKQHWSTYWNQGFITSFGASFEKNYTGVLRQLWDNIFSQLRAGDSLLDIATGNGALACIAAENLEKKGLSVHISAADAAEIPEKINAPEFIQKQRERIKFFSNMPCENLEFPDDTFDIITSQYGVEYSDWETSLAEIFRILKRSGSAHLVCHCQASSLIEASMADIAIYDAAFHENAIFEAAVNFCKGLEQQVPAERPKLSHTLNREINLFRENHRQQELCATLISDISSQLKQLKETNPATVIVKLNERKDEYAAAYSRLKDMTKAALSENGVKQFRETGLSSGFSSAKVNELYQDGKLIGVHFHLIK